MSEKKKTANKIRTTTSLNISPEVARGRQIFLKLILGIHSNQKFLSDQLSASLLLLILLRRSVFLYPHWCGSWSGHSSVIPWIGAWSSRGCCHGNCQGNRRKGTDDCLDWRVLDGKVGSTLQSWLSASGSVWQTEAFGMGRQQIPKCRKSCQRDCPIRSACLPLVDSCVTKHALALWVDRCESAKADLERRLLFRDPFSAFAPAALTFYKVFEEDAASCKIMALIVLDRCPIIDSHIEQIVSLMYQTSGAKLTSSSRSPFSQRGT